MVNNEHAPKKKIVIAGLLAVVLSSTLVVLSSTINGEKTAFPTGKTRMDPKAAAAREYDWYNTWDGGGRDTGGDVCWDPAGYAYVVGTTDVGSGNYDIVVRKYAPDGSLEWSRTWGGAQNETGTGVWTNGSAVFVGGTTRTYGNGQEDCVLLKYSTAGAFQWYTTVGGTGVEYAGGLAGDDAGLLYLVGSTTSFGNGENLAVNKFTSGGSYIYTITRAIDGEWVNDAEVDDSGKIYLTGVSLNRFKVWKMDAEGNILWEKSPSATASAGFGVWTNGTHVYAAGGTSAGTSLTVGYDSSGNEVFSDSWSGDGSNTAPKGKCVWGDSYGDVYTSGRVTHTGDDLFVRKVRGGVTQWTVVRVASGDQDANGMVGQGNGSLYLAGSDGTDLAVLNFDDNDIDEDSLLNADESTWGTGINDPDSDDDGLTDGYEVGAGTKPLDGDSDGDTLGDGAEVNVYGTDPLKSDTDGDGMPDPWELGYQLDPTSAADGPADSDGDDLTNVQEYLHNTDPLEADTDEDGLTDYEEVTSSGTNPLSKDTDGDDVPDLWEVTWHTDPLVADSGEDPDGDGLKNSEEYAFHTDPHSNDTDGDGLSDKEEIVTTETDPSKADTDGDGLSDSQEYHIYHTDPNIVDTDGDGFSDGDEVEAGTNPLSRWSSPSILAGWRTAGLWTGVAAIAAGASFAAYKAVPPVIRARRGRTQLKRAREEEIIAREEEARLAEERRRVELEARNSAWAKVLDSLPAGLGNFSGGDRSPPETADASAEVTDAFLRAAANLGAGEAVTILRRLARFQEKYLGEGAGAASLRAAAGFLARDGDYAAAAELYGRSNHALHAQICRGISSGTLDGVRIGVDLGAFDGKYPGEDRLAGFAALLGYLSGSSRWEVSEEGDADGAASNRVSLRLEVPPSGGWGGSFHEIEISGVEFLEGCPLFKVRREDDLPQVVSGTKGFVVRFRARVQATAQVGGDGEQAARNAVALTVRATPHLEKDIRVLIPPPDLEAVVARLKADEEARASGHADQGGREASSSRASLTWTFQSTKYENHELRRKQFLRALYNSGTDVRVLGVILVDEKTATIGVVQDAGIQEMTLTTIRSGLAGKHHAGGWSQARFERLHEEGVQVFLERVARRANRAFLDSDVDHILVGGNEFRARAFLTSNLLDYRLRERVADEPVPVQYDGIAGMRELLQRVEPYLLDLECVRLQGLFNLFLEGVSLGLTEVAYGIEEVERVLQEGRVEVLLLGTGLDDDVKGRLREEAAKFSTRVEEFPRTTEWGDQLHSTFGGVAALLRY
ncbi:MAG: baeRF10 domain-containing protein [Promethearchaeota archaeon]